MDLDYKALAAGIAAAIIASYATHAQSSGKACRLDDDRATTAAKEKPAGELPPVFFRPPAVRQLPKCS